MEAPPERVEAAERVTGGDLQHHAPAGVLLEGHDEWADVGHVVEDVAADDDVRAGNARSDVGPAADYRHRLQAPPGGPGPQLGEQVRILVDGDQGAGRGQR